MISQVLFCLDFLKISVLFCACTTSNSWFFVFLTDLDKAILFEVSCMDLQNICVTFEASQGGGIASFELNFSELRNIQCSMHKMIVGNSPFNKEIIGSPETVAKTVFEK